MIQNLERKLSSLIIIDDRWPLTIVFFCCCSIQFVDLKAMVSFHDDHLQHCKCFGHTRFFSFRKSHQLMEAAIQIEWIEWRSLHWQSIDQNSGWSKLTIESLIFLLFDHSNIEKFLNNFSLYVNRSRNREEIHSLQKDSAKKSK